ncbi:MAG TPA: hypothetical protein VGC98_02835 [Thermoleophilaceae bacterium]
MDKGIAKQDPVLAPADGTSQTGTFQLGGSMLPGVVRFAVFPGDNEDVRTVRVPLGARFTTMSGTFGLDRSHTPCTSGSASLAIKDDAGNPVWPERGNPPLLSGAETAHISGKTTGVGQLVLVFSSSVPSGDCADNNQEVDVGLALDFTRK